MGSAFSSRPTMYRKRSEFSLGSSFCSLPKVKSPSCDGLFTLVELVGTRLIIRVVITGLWHDATLVSTNSQDIGYLPRRGLYPLKSLSQEKDPSCAEVLFLVELVGTAPTSAGLSWLVVYRHSSFCGLSRVVSKRTNIHSEQS